MAKRVVDDTSLTAVADAIRSKAGTEDALSFPDGFINAVEGIPEPVEVYQNSYGTHYVANMVVRAAGLTFGNLAESAYLNSFTLYGVSEIGYRTEYNILANCKNLKAVYLPDLYLLNTLLCFGCTALETAEIGSVGVPVTHLRAGDPFKNCTQSTLTITVYVDAAILADIPTNVIGNAPWGATNATIVYRNSTTGEVITE